MFHVGQKVVCIDAAQTHLDRRPELVEGGVYTISWIGQPPLLLQQLIENGILCVNRHRNAPYFVHLAEVKRASEKIPLLKGRGVPFASTRFRPLVGHKIERKAEITGPRQLENA